jgi:PAS domain S-box-containing protein
LQASSELAAIFEHSLDGILLTAADGRVLKANPAATRILRRSEAEIRAAGRRGIMDAQDARLEAAMRERAETGHFAGELTLIRGDGERFRAEIASTLFTGEDGIPRAYIIFRDTSACELRAAEVQAAVKTLRAVIDAAPLAVQGITVDGTVTLWNDAAERLFGWSAEEVIGQPNRLVPADRVDEHLALRARAMANEVLTGVELTRLHKDGSFIEVSLSTAAVHDYDGCIVGIIALFEDIGARKAAERVRIREHELEAMRQLALGVRHEVNNALAALRGELELLFTMPTLQRDELEGLGSAISQTDRIAAALRRISHVEGLQSVPYAGTMRMLDVSDPNR